LISPPIAFRLSSRINDIRPRLYALKDGAMAELKRWLADTEAMWAAQLSGFKAHVEKKRK
jgi:hypothetical protein